MSGPQGDYGFSFFFFASQFHYKGLHTVVERGEAEEQPSLNCGSVSISWHHCCFCFIVICLELNGLVRMERHKFPFSIENILRKYPNSNGTSGAGIKEKAVSPAGGQTEAVHHACLCCCYCSHCGDIYQADFIHEGECKQYTV